MVGRTPPGLCRPVYMLQRVFALILKSIIILKVKHVELQVVVTVPEVQLFKLPSVCRAVGSKLHQPILCTKWLHMGSTSSFRNSGLVQTNVTFHIATYPHLNPDHYFYIASDYVIWHNTTWCSQCIHLFWLTNVSWSRSLLMYFRLSEQLDFRNTHLSVSVTGIVSLIKRRQTK